jgi:starvation-inducible outer membrane lipoprotein
MTTKKRILFFTTMVIVLALCMPQHITAQDMKMKKEESKMKDSKMKDSKMKMGMDDLKSWPMASQMAAKEQMDLYGKPNEMTPTMLVWHNNGAWKKTVITNYESKHNFPVMHTDCMEQVIHYKVPPDMGDELAIFDGSVTIDRTQGTIAARCDKEENNMLALNLAHDIITGKKTVEEARAAYGKIVMDAKNGQKSDYMKKLMFNANMSAPDPDVVTVGMEKKAM